MSSYLHHLELTKEAKLIVVHQELHTIHLQRLHIL